MSDVPAAMAPDEARRLSAMCEALAAATGAAWAAVVSGGGHLLATGERAPPLDTTLLASLVASGMAATGAIAELVDEPPFPAVLLEGQQISFHLAGLGNGGVLVVAFRDRATVGLVRLRAAQAADGISQILAGLKAPTSTQVTALDITDADIDALFGA